MTDTETRAGYSIDPEASIDVLLCRIAQLRAENARLREALEDAIAVADGLYGQQAMPDESQRPVLEKARAALAMSEGKKE